MICKEIIIASISTLGYLVSNIISKKENKILSAIIYFFMFWLILSCANYLFASNTDKEDGGQDIDLDGAYFYGNNYESGKQPITKCQKDLYNQLSEECFRQGVFWLSVAQERSLLIPDKDLKDMVHTAITAAVAGAVSKDLKAFAITTIVAMVGTYLCNVWDEWQRLEMDLMRSEVYFDMSNFYRNVARCNGNILIGCPPE